MDGTSAVVTGASRGIGASVAKRLAAEGAHVTCCARRREVVESVVADITDAGGVARAVRADVRDEFDVERLMETAAREGDGIDLVVANAAVNHGDPGSSPLDEESYSRFDDTIRTNLRGVFTTVREALPHLAGDGRILVPSGAVARESTPGMGAYAVSKAGAEALVRGFAADVEQSVAAVDPGYVATDLSGDRGRDPADVAPMFVWAARDAEDVDGEILDLRTWKSATR
ncbi:SDR family NAD(P)-dependent oxidoreductase [Haloplanus pelagicus]|jgi:NAD(P)-dependent dehydrogenase (short-subunit alcohol dehydrogenase family)|uniref:SDR family NAD(P)-dependent oxidoreductase n=1 Tax=Haloplanus pelagicus TaxID=2949995 RepID=UPI002041CDCA|nr:SDR family oxidoreductase [Haloplanus sp. HW8-1]